MEDVGVSFHDHLQAFQADAVLYDELTELDGEARRNPVCQKLAQGRYLIAHWLESLEKQDEAGDRNGIRLAHPERICGESVALREGK